MAQRPIQKTRSHRFQWLLGVTGRHVAWERVKVAVVASQHVQCGDENYISALGLGSTLVAKLELYSISRPVPKKNQQSPPHYPANVGGSRS